MKLLFNQDIIQKYTKVSTELACNTKTKNHIPGYDQNITEVSPFNATKLKNHYGKGKCFNEQNE